MEQALDLSGMTAEQLANALREAELQLEDVREERLHTLGQTGVHLGAAKVVKMRVAWDREEQALLERIVQIKKQLVGVGPNY